MISSVIAKFRPGQTELAGIVDEISAHPNLEVGALIDDRMLPITIDAADNCETETVTQWLQGREGVEFVDVVFVHFE